MREREFVMQGGFRASPRASHVTVTVAATGRWTLGYHDSSGVPIYLVRRLTSKAVVDCSNLITATEVYGSEGTWSIVLEKYRS